MSDEYDNVAKGKLKLKKDNEFKRKKKSKKKIRDKDKEKMRKAIEDEQKQEQESMNDPKQYIPRQLTKAELSFKKMQDKMQTKRIMDKASTTHKQRVEKFNEHLDGLTEHFDIPKVSWTK